MMACSGCGFTAMDQIPPFFSFCAGLVGWEHLWFPGARFVHKELGNINDECHRYHPNALHHELIETFYLCLMSAAGDIQLQRQCWRTWGRLGARHQGSSFHYVVAVVCFKPREGVVYMVHPEAAEEAGLLDDASRWRWLNISGQTWTWQRSPWPFARG